MGKTNKIFFQKQKNRFSKMSSKRSRHSRSRTHGSSRHSEEDDGSGSDMDIEKELHPLSHYVNDRKKLIDQAFKVIGDHKLRDMCSSGLRGLKNEELKALCLTQLEGMSKKRIKNVLAGRDMDESSATDEDSDDDNQKDEEEGGMAGSLGDLIKPAILNKSPQRVKKSKTPEAIVIQDSPKSDKEEEEEDEDLADVIAKRPKDLAKKANVDLNYGKKEKTAPSASAKVESETKGIMELMELEMRARAIKSLLSRTKTSDDQLAQPSHAPEAPPEEKKKEKVKKPEKEEDEKKVPLIKKDPLEYQREMEEKKKLHKAKEALAISSAKKRKQEQEEQDRLDEIKRKIEAQKAKEKAEEEELKRIQAEEDDKIRKKKVNI